MRSTLTERKPSFTGANTMADALFRHHNARHSTAAEIARTFVPPTFFDDLLEAKHVVLVGPRGSGKTTLLKMLTTPAIEAWNHPLAEKARQKTSYTSVYVPSDITWREQFIALEKQLGDAELATTLARCAFTSHLHRAFVSAVMTRLETYIDPNHRTAPFRRLPFARAQEESLTRSLAKTWNFSRPAPTLPILREMLSERIEEIYVIANQEKLLGTDGRAQRLASNRWLHVNYLHSIPTLIEVTNNALNEPLGRWGFLFDELEIAPEWLQRELYASLRSIEQRAILKLAMAPYMPFGTIVPDAKPIGVQDYTPIPLLGQNVRNTVNFCRAIWDQLIQDRNLDPVAPEDVLGWSRWSDDPEESDRKYIEGSKFAEQVEELRAKDPSFDRYIDRYQAQPARWAGMNERKRAQILRKAQPIIYLRNYYLKSGGAKMPPRKSRKAHGLFGGYPTVFTLTDGNPRLIKAVLSALIDDWMRTRRRVDFSIQGRILKQAAEIFKSTLSNAVGPQPRIRRFGTGVVPLLECISAFLAEGVYGSGFNPDPRLTFIVDDRTPFEVANAIGVALNLGGVVLVGSESDELFGDVLGKRFRLCYLIGLLEELPTRLGPEVNLSKVLEGNFRTLDVPVPQNLQLGLDAYDEK